MADIQKDWGKDFVAQDQIRHAKDLQTYKEWKAKEGREPEETQETEKGEKTQAQLAAELVKNTQKLEEEKQIKKLEEKQLQEEVKNKLLARLEDQNIRNMDIDPQILSELIEDVQSGNALEYAEDPDAEADEITKQLISTPQNMKKLVEESSPGAKYKPEDGKEERKEKA